MQRTAGAKWELSHTQLIAVLGWLGSSRFDRLTDERLDEYERLAQQVGYFGQMAFVQSVAANGLAGEVGPVSFGDNATTDVGLMPPGSPVISVTINNYVPDGLSNCGEALEQAVTLAMGSATGEGVIVFAADGCTEGLGPDLSTAVVPPSVIVNLVSGGVGCSNPSVSLIARNGGQCLILDSFSDGPNIIADLTLTQ